MNYIISEVLFNRALIWLLMALVDDNPYARAVYVTVAAYNVWKSFVAFGE